MKNVDEILDQYLNKAPVNVEAIIRALGLQLDKKADLADGISGQLERLPEGLFRISANKNDHYYRQRFTMAHELGHFLLHLHLVGEGVDDSKAYRSERKGKFFNPKITPAHETEANRFAADILTPAQLVKERWNQGEQDIGVLSKAFKVSKAAMEIRLKQLKLAG